MQFNLMQQKDNFLNTFFLIFFKWLIFLPMLVYLSFYAFRKKQALGKNVCFFTFLYRFIKKFFKMQQFFANFRVGGHRGSPIKQPENTIASMEQVNNN